MAKVPAIMKKNPLVDWNAALRKSAEQTKKAAAVMGTVSKYLSFKGATLTVGGASVEPTWIHCIVLATMNERAFYEGAYKDGEMRSPVCFAYGAVDGELAEAPHDDSTKPQHEICATCPHAVWGSAGGGARGQLCKQSLRMALIRVSDKPTAGKSVV